MLRTCDKKELALGMPVRATAPAAAVPTNVAKIAQANTCRRGFADPAFCEAAAVLDVWAAAFDGGLGSFIPSTSNNA
jgi:hypothetical protein